jgi:hypothetical protein
VRPQDLHNVYLLAKGGSYANTLLDAEAALAEGNYAKTIELVKSMRDVYYKSQLRKLRLDPTKSESPSKNASREAEKIRKKQEKIHTVLAHLDVVLAALERMAKRQPKAPEPSASNSAISHRSQSAVRVTSEFAVKFSKASDYEDELETLRESYDIQPVRSKGDLGANQLYYLLAKDRSYLVRTPEKEPLDPTVSFELAITGRRLKPLPTEKLLRLGTQRRLWRLARKGEPETHDSESTPTNVQQTESPSSDDGATTRDRPCGVLDMGAFSQLLQAAQSCGIVPNADLIGHVRDREFRMGNYQKAFQLIEGLHSKFTTAAINRAARLKREDLDIAAGRVKMSPKEIQQKRVRDTTETQRVERTRYRFTRVMEGLRILMQNQPSEAARASDNASSGQ